MDYGHAGNNPLNSPQDFGFTSGVGEIPAEQNPLAPEQNLNSNAWDIQPKAISSESPAEVPANPTEAPHLIPEETINSALNNREAPLGQIVPLATPEAAPAATPVNYDESTIRAESDHISRTTLHAVEHLSNSLTATTPLGPFYAEIAQMRDDYLNNSFNRKRSA